MTRGTGSINQGMIACVPRPTDIFVARKAEIELMDVWDHESIVSHSSIRRSAKCCTVTLLAPRAVQEAEWMIVEGEVVRPKKRSLVAMRASLL